MSGQATGWVLRHGPKDRALRLVLLTIADAANRDGEHAHPGMAAIVDGSLYSQPHAYRAIKKLLEDGWLEVEEQGNGRGQATVYRIPGVADKPSHGENDDPRNPLIPSAKPSHSERETLSSELPILCSSTVTTNEENNDPPNTPQTLVLSEGPPDPQRLSADASFALFIEAYPRRDSEAAARKAWARALKKVGGDHRILVEAAARYRDDPNRDDSFTFKPNNWLREEHWRDEPQVAPRSHLSRSVQVAKNLYGTFPDSNPDERISDDQR